MENKNHHEANVWKQIRCKKHLFTEKLDDILLHRTWGYLILIAVLFLLFQSIFVIAQFPMDGIEWTFAEVGGWLGKVLACRVV